MQSDAIEFCTDRAERLVVGVSFVFIGGGALAFWNVERSTQWPLLMILLIGACFAMLGIFMIAFRRVVRLEPRHGASELQTLFGAVVARRSYPLTDFEAVGSHGSIQEGPWWDIVLFRHDGRFLTLRAMLSDTETKREIARVAQLLGLPTESEPRARFYLFK